MAQAHLKAVIVRVTVDGKEVVTQAVGESMTGVPATTGMHFRNGAVAISYVSTLLLKLVDEKKVSLDDKLSKWLPEIPHADRVTLGQLAQMTSGYVDYVIGNTAMNDALYANPFRRWTTHDLLQLRRRQPLLYEPGTNWNYAHTNYVLLGLALEKATGQEMSKLLSDKVLRPLGLTNTVNSLHPRDPVARPARVQLSERRAALKIPAGTPFYEESTFWDPSWTITHGAIQTTNIYDMEATAVGIGSGKLLTADSYKKMVSTDLRGKTHKQPGCTTCDAMNDVYTYGLGIVISGNWLLQNPLCSRVRRRSRPTCRRRRSRSPSPSPTPPKRSMTRAITATRPTRCSAGSAPSWPPTMRHPCRHRNNAQAWRPRFCSSTTSTSRPKPCWARRSRSAASTSTRSRSCPPNASTTRPST